MRPRIVSAGWVASALLALAGVWLLIAPDWVGYQPHGAAWLAATDNDVMVGAVLFGVSILGLFAQVAFGLRDLADHQAERAAALSRESVRP